MTKEMDILVATAATVAFLHTLFGPDHYLPFIAMGKARRWSMMKTSLITILGGTGHVLGSVVLGMIGVVAGIGIQKVTQVESVRGSLAGWLFIAFGLVYMVWGIRRAWMNKPHTHLHSHAGGLQHEHSHTHHDNHAHVHDREEKKNITPWILFTIFVLGPCEPLIPIVMYPAARGDYSELFITVLIFAVVTILTMLALVLGTLFGLNLMPLGKMERYMHALAGGTILFSGMSIVFLGW
ncbi:MAG: sulfite exporter TauE/SafE family protein [Bacteroidales bacterium]|nr:sulfite exporter TauE/SafE family protein [Bacteroidales bacterium]